MTPQHFLERKMGISHTLMSKLQHDEDEIVANASREVTARLLGKAWRQQWFPDVDKRLYALLVQRRKRGLRLSTLWIGVTCRRLLKGIHPDDPRAQSIAASG